MSKRILLVATNVDQYEIHPSTPTGLWLSELSHPYNVFESHGFQQTIASPAGGKVALEPRSLKFPSYEKSAQAWHEDPARMALLEDTPSTDELDSNDYDAIFLTGGHGTMFDFPKNKGLLKLTQEIFERGGIVAAVCHGYCGLLNAKLANGTYLLAGRDITGFSWPEEVLAGVSRIVPYNVEQLSKDRGASYSKALIPFISNTVVDGNLVTGQNPASAKATAMKVAELL